MVDYYILIKLILITIHFPDGVIVLTEDYITCYAHIKFLKLTHF